MQYTSDSLNGGIKSEPNIKTITA